MLELVRPNTALKASFLEAIREAQSSGSGLASTLAVSVDMLEAKFEAYVAERLRMDDPAFVPSDKVLQTDFWLVDDGRYMGLLKLRHALNDALRMVGGHIGYEVRPLARGQGYATRMLALGLLEARKLGLARVMLTCDDDNVASYRVMESNGARLEAVIQIPGREEPTRHYWIELS
jgi:predicted acetyltransferase